MYGSSIVFPLSRVTDPRLRELLALNPMVPIIESVRLAFLGQGSVTQGQWLVSCGLSVGVFLLGVVMFNRTEQTAMDAA
jgi:lipopolysaccharide transport system permease protein